MLKDRLKEARKKAGKSQKDVVAAVGITQSALSQLETGLVNSSSHLPSIAKFLGVDAYWLQTGEGKPSLNNDVEKSEITSFKKLDIEDFKKKYNISDSDEAVLFSTIAEKPFVISKRWVPVKAYSKMGMDGYFTDMGYDGNAGDGYVPTHTAGDRSYAIKGTGDSMYPAIRNGWYVVCDPDAELTPSEFVQVCLKDGRCTIKEFIGIHNNVLNLLAVNGGERLTFDMDEVESITAITDIVPPSQHRQEYPHSH
ncbi:helix-turn-helix domain-containing protein [Acinetobacter nosocomialis]|uniref:helix-turn-helix domain-containing protein n=1 Tax=Acinetobacter nosocomialis TaxID=106654 RepID=UPI001B819456|nr:helix-turn-helix domain-containing protein [Acinetobacter nosocomialis]MBR7679994.1 helix-turn-helix transcriptional regulator [Acinetobacter nosocomialis]